MRCKRTPSSSLGDLILGELVRNRGVILATVTKKKRVVMETKKKTVLAVKKVVVV